MINCNRHPRESGGPEPALWRRRPWIPAFAGMTILMLAGCHGSPNDAIFPGTLGHDPPPAVNLPPQDAGMERR
jgi:hypothetical protein